MGGSQFKVNVRAQHDNSSVAVSMLAFRRGVFAPKATNVRCRNIAQLDMVKHNRGNVSIGSTRLASARYSTVAFPPAL